MYTRPTGYVDAGPDLEHRLAAERALGRPLPKGAEVHHVDGNRSNNAPSNLVICPSRAYHRLLHARERALLACGNANWRKCQLCKQYDAPDNLSSTARKPRGRLRTESSFVYHKACMREKMRAYRELKKCG